MKRILVCQHVAHELLGTLNPLIKDHGFRIKYANFGRYPNEKQDLEGYDGLVILGGPMNVDETDKHPHLNHEIELIQSALTKNLPILGICLGAQLIAKALGAKVGRNPTKEIGWYDLQVTDAGRSDPIFSHFGPTEKMFQWHGDTFEMPKGAMHLARSPFCENQAFRYGENVYGLQFHMEVDEPMIHRWMQVSPNKEEIAGLSDSIRPEMILQETHHYILRLKELGLRGFSAFMNLFGIPKKFHRLTSR